LAAGVDEAGVLPKVTAGAGAERLLAESVLVVGAAPKVNAGKGGVTVPASSSLLVSLPPVAAAPVGNTKELALLLLSSLVAVDVGIVKPEIAGAADETVDAAGAEPKAPNENPIEAVAGAAAAVAAAPKVKPPVVTAALDVPVAAAAAGAVKVNPPVDMEPTPVVVDDDAGAVPTNEKPPTPMEPAVVVVVVVAVAVAAAVVVPPTPTAPPRGCSQAAHVFNPLSFIELHVSHFHLSFVNLAKKTPKSWTGPD
jgi:hypothetical protein